MTVQLLTPTLYYLFILSEEIAFYNGNMREKQTIYSTFKKLVGSSLVLFSGMTGTCVSSDCFDGVGSVMSFIAPVTTPGVTVF